MGRLKIFFYLALTVVSLNILVAQGGFIRSIHLPGAKLQVSHSVLQLPNGHYLHVGLTIDTIGNSQVQRLCVMALNSIGQIIWIKKYGNLNKTYLDNISKTNWVKCYNNNFYYHTNIYENGISKGAVIKFDSNGDTIWQKRYLSHNSEAIVINAITKTYDNGFLLAGSISDQQTNTRLLIIKINTLGNELWRQVINKSSANGPNYQTPDQIVQDSLSKKIILVGDQYIGNSTSWFSHPNIVITDSLGNFLERRSYPNTYTRGILSDIIQTKDGNFVAVGCTSSEMSGTDELRYGYTVKFELNTPMPIWQKTYMDEKSIINIYTSIIEKKNGDLVLAGTQDTSYLKGIAIRNMGKITWLTSTGEFIKKRYYNYIPSNSSGIFTDNLYAFNTTNDNGFISCYYDQGGGQLQRKFFIVKYDSLGCDTTAAYCATVGFKNQSYQAIDVSIYPQPAKQFINLQSTLFANKKSQVYISNAIGQICYNASVQFNNGNTQLNLANLPKGIYFLKLVDEDLRSFTSKIVLE
jgi:hypothetical protein